MDGKDYAPNSAPKYLLSAEITPAEYEFYIQRTQQIRAESVASVFRAILAALPRLFAASRRRDGARHEPVLVKPRAA